MAKVYTKTGDKGETSLVGGSRVSKSNDIIDLYGDVDELNSVIGICLSVAKENNIKCSQELMGSIQSKLFDLGSNLACEADKRVEFQLPQIETQIIKLIENEIDLLDSDLPKIRNFVLPGGSLLAAFLHQARTVTRRVERKLVFRKELHSDTPENSIEFINRLSDFLFVLSRSVNHTQGIQEVFWKPTSKNLGDN